MQAEILLVIGYTLYEINLSNFANINFDVIMLTIAKAALVSV